MAGKHGQLQAKEIQDAEICFLPGLPSPRTCYVDLTLSIKEALPPSHLGLYLMVEKPSAQWLSSQWHQKGGAVLKPVTMRLFEYLGDAWDTYEGIYDPKTALSDAQKQQIGPDSTRDGDENRPLAA